MSSFHNLTSIFLVQLFAQLMNSLFLTPYALSKKSTCNKKARSCDSVEGKRQKSSIFLSLLKRRMKQIFAATQTLYYCVW